MVAKKRQVRLFHSLKRKHENGRVVIVTAVAYLSLRQKK